MVCVAFGAGVGAGMVAAGGVGVGVVLNLTFCGWVVVGDGEGVFKYASNSLSFFCGIACFSGLRRAFFAGPSSVDFDDDIDNVGLLLG